MISSWTQSATVQLPPKQARVVKVIGSPIQTKRTWGVLVEGGKDLKGHTIARAPTATMSHNLQMMIQILGKVVFPIIGAAPILREWRGDRKKRGYGVDWMDRILS
jgi:hypothetical protein